MTANLSTRLEIPVFGPGEVELSLEYDVTRRALTVHDCFADIGGAEIAVWHNLDRDQRTLLAHRCAEDYRKRMAT